MFNNPLLLRFEDLFCKLCFTHFLSFPQPLRPGLHCQVLLLASGAVFPGILVRAGQDSVVLWRARSEALAFRRLSSIYRRRQLNYKHPSSTKPCTLLIDYKFNTELQAVTVR